MIYDHYPHDDCQLSPALLREIAALVAMVAPAPPPNSPPPSRFVKRGYYTVCERCQLVSTYCKCAMQPQTDASAQDGQESGLAQRIRDYKGRP